MLKSFFRPSAYDRASWETIEALQAKRLRVQVDTAYSKVRFWRELFDTAGIRPQEIATPEDLTKLPLTSKVQLVSRPLRDRLASDDRHLVRMFTSGTTGPPMHVYYSRGFALLTAMYLHDHFRRWFGLGRFYRIMQLSSHSPSSGTATAQRPRVRRSMKAGYAAVRPLIERFARMVYFENSISEAVPSIESFAPDVIMANASYLRLMARHFEESGRKIAFTPKILISTGEPLDEPTRDYVERTMGVPVRQMYGSNETGPLALECLEGRRLHTFSDRAIIEVLSVKSEKVRPGELGEIVVTEMTNQGMPLLRYRMQDVGYGHDSPGETCPCGRSLSLLLKSVEGRSIDCIRTRDGRLVTPKRVLTLMNAVDGGSSCQLVQRSPDAFTLRVLCRGVTSGSVTDLAQSLAEEIGQGSAISVSWEAADGEPKKTRKLRPVIVEPPSGPSSSR